MGWYQQLISEATGRTDPKHIQAIEEVMRTEHGTLDHLSRSRFIADARMSEQVCILLGDFT